MKDQWLNQIDKETQHDLSLFMMVAIADYRLITVLAAYAYMRTNFTVYAEGV